jgi:hypothetical protein
MMAQVSNVHDVSWGPANKTGNINQATFGYGGNDSVIIERHNTVANATAACNEAINGPNELKSITVRSETPNYWGLSYYKNATGHAPTVQKATTAYVGGSYQQHQSEIQYDTLSSTTFTKIIRTERVK